MSKKSRSQDADRKRKCRQKQIKINFFKAVSVEKTDATAPDIIS